MKLNFWSYNVTDTHNTGTISYNWCFFMAFNFVSLTFFTGSKNYILEFFFLKIYICLVLYCTILMKLFGFLNFLPQISHLPKSSTNTSTPLACISQLWSLRLYTIAASYRWGNWGVQLRFYWCYKRAQERNKPFGKEISKINFSSYHLSCPHEDLYLFWYGDGVRYKKR